eukprot:TRINITY_DN6176_c0_g1_i1.p1 TRINITY_DN6176_c0_g1~~TRINITY_DN6176_c0_g1_i1.p1  ORF type:complete len:146 (+),score=6.60 TRINITY_DN6176_c0_g1_i1:383-820(+)
MYVDIKHAFCDCPALTIIRNFITLNSEFIPSFKEENMRGIVLFGGFNTGKRCKEENTVRASLLNCKAYIAKKLMGGETINARDLRSIMVSAAARYAAFSLRIPMVQSSAWNNASEVIKYFPSTSPLHTKSLEIIIRQFKKFKNNQ